jgi:hypothetical protein
MLPDFVEPCLPSPADRPPSDPGWVHEIKHDGFRWLAATPPASACSLVTGTTGRGEPLIVEAVNRLWVTTANQERELREIAGRMGCEIVKVYKDQRRQGPRLCGVNPSTVQRISRPFVGASVAVA